MSDVSLVGDEPEEDMDELGTDAMPSPSLPTYSPCRSLRRLDGITSGMCDASHCECEEDVTPLRRHSSSADLVNDPRDLNSRSSTSLASQTLAEIDPEEARNADDIAQDLDDLDLDVTDEATSAEVGLEVDDVILSADDVIPNAGDTIPDLEDVIPNADDVTANTGDVTMDSDDVTANADDATADRDGFDCDAGISQRTSSLDQWKETIAFISEQLEEETDKIVGEFEGANSCSLEAVCLIISLSLAVNLLVLAWRAKTTHHTLLYVLVMAVQIDKRWTVGQLKELLQPKLGVDMKCFKLYKIYSNNQVRYYTCYSTLSGTFHQQTQAARQL